MACRIQAGRTFVGGRADPETENARYAKRETALMFPIVPPSSRNPPSMRPYAMTIHCRVLCPMPRSCWIEGRATFTIAISSTTMNCAAHDSTRTIPLLVCLGCHDGLLSDLDRCALHLQLPEMPYLDGSGPRAGYLRSDFDRFVEVLAVDQAVAADLLLGLRKPVRNQDLAVANLNGRSLPRRSLIPETKAEGLQSMHTLATWESLPRSSWGGRLSANARACC